MDKRYQVFLSSTYADLKDERQKVIQDLMEMDCIQAGMELFPRGREKVSRTRKGVKYGSVEKYLSVKES